MIEELLPESVVTVETHGDDQDWGAPLYPGEQQLVARSVEKRRREFAAVRACARQAMEKLGVPAQAVLRGEHGAPVWPAGLIGSMTHCEGYCAASLVRATDLASLGIDAESHEELPDDVIVSVALPTEIDRLRELARQDASVHWDRLLFSAKESVYKAWYPLTGKWLDFLEADIELFADDGPARSGGLRAELLVPGPLVNGRRIQTFEGRWTVRRGLLATAVTVPHTGADA